MSHERNKRLRVNESSGSSGDQPAARPWPVGLCKSMAEIIAVIKEPRKLFSSKTISKQLWKLDPSLSGIEEIALVNAFLIPWLNRYLDYVSYLYVVEFNNNTHIKSIRLFRDSYSEKLRTNSNWKNFRSFMRDQFSRDDEIAEDPPLALRFLFEMSIDKSDWFVTYLLLKLTNDVEYICEFLKKFKLQLYNLVGHSVYLNNSRKSLKEALRSFYEFLTEIHVVAKNAGVATIDVISAIYMTKVSVKECMEAENEEHVPPGMTHVVINHQGKWSLERYCGENNRNVNVNLNLNPVIPDEDFKKGDDCFEKQMYLEAIGHYTESLRKNPNNPKVYSNRAACYTKLVKLREALKDAEKCIELNPQFSEGYVRKGGIYYRSRQYDKAWMAYQEGMKYYPNDKDLKAAAESCYSKICAVTRESRLSSKKFWQHCRNLG